MFPLQEYRLLFFIALTKIERNDKKQMLKEDLENRFWNMLNEDKSLVQQSRMRFF